MALNGRRRGDNGLNAWPGYVDALSTLLMVIIFVLLVFVLAQAFLSVALSGRDEALDRLNRQMAALTDMLSLERGHSHDLQVSVSQLTRDLQSATAARDAATQQLAAQRADAARAIADRDALRDERDTLAAELADQRLEAGAALKRADQLQAHLAATSAPSDRQAAALATQLADAQAQLASMRAQMAALDKTVSVDKATIEARLSDLARLTDEVRALTALRDQLEAQVRDTAARATTAEQQNQAMATQLADERKYGDSARAQIALLNQQLDAVRAQLRRLAAALDVSQAAGQAKDVQIAHLGEKLNAALASKVEELQRYRSDFFGRLRAVLADQPGVQIVGDRFVFQSEVLFPAGSAMLSPSGREQIDKLAATLKQITPRIPADLPWMLRVDGHADRQPIANSAFASNWELSSARAMTVVRQLIAEGIPAPHLAATAFSSFQPLDLADTQTAYARNRRIELRLTDR